jgi:hypothetical protein
MRVLKDQEERAIRRLIEEIDALDARRERPGRIVLGLFAAAFVCSLGLLIYTVSYAHPAVSRTIPAPAPAVP